MNGTDLRKLRRQAGLSQAELAARAGIGRHAVSYWECKARVDLRSWAIIRMRDAMGPDYLPHFSTPNARAGGWGLRMQAYIAAEEKRREKHLLSKLENLDRRKPPILKLCGAKTRKGSPCRNKSVPGKPRCKFHGGLSTGPRTAEGKRRIAEAQRRRWVKYRADGIVCT